MMQEVGRANSTCGRILSIQSQLGGLSFYCKEDKVSDFKAVRNEDEVAVIIAEEILGGNYEEVNFYHNDPRYIIIPRELFDENMSDAYLLTKGITPSQEETITITLRNELAFISVIRKELIVAEVPFIVFPLVEKCIANCESFDNDVISYVIEDEMLHVAYGKHKALKFVESLPLAAESDFEFFIEKITTTFNLKNNRKIISLYENGIYSVSQNVSSTYKIKRMLRANYFEL